MTEGKICKAFNFDLNIKKLKEFYPNSDYKQAYKDLKRFFKSNGFKHRQWSGYISEKPLSVSEVLDFTEQLWNKFPWLELCATRFDVTNIGKTYDLLAMRVASKSPTRKEKVYNFKKGRVNSGSAFTNAKSQANTLEPEATQARQAFKRKR